MNYDKQTEALKLALEALLSCSAGDYSTGHVIHPSFDVDAVNKAIEAIREALAEQPAQQVVEPKRKPLKDEQIMEMYNEPRSDAEMIEFARAIEAAHGIKGDA